jgi:hypothetical protein
MFFHDRTGDLDTDRCTGTEINNSDRQRLDCSDGALGGSVSVFEQARDRQTLKVVDLAFFGIRQRSIGFSQSFEHIEVSALVWMVQ